MIEQNNQQEAAPHFINAIIIHSFFGSIAYSLIVITIIVYISNIIFLITCIGIISGLLFILAYALISKNPYYYITSTGLLCLVIVPSAIFLTFFIGSTTWAYEPLKIYVIFALIIEVLYIFLLIREISNNKYLRYFYRRYTIGYPIRRGTLFLPLHHSVKDFDRLNKGSQYWQDRDPEEVKKIEEELKNFKKKHKKNMLIAVQILGFLSFNVIFYLSLMF